jgi:hypothetical protein
MVPAIVITIVNYNHKTFIVYATGHRHGIKPWTPGLIAHISTTPQGVLHLPRV